MPLEVVLAALEGAGVPIDRSALPTSTQLGKAINLPCGGAVAATPRATLRKAIVAMVKGIAAAVNTDGPGTVAMVAEALLPPARIPTRKAAQSAPCSPP